MLHFSFSTVLMTFLASAVAAGLISFVFSNRRTMVCIGYKCLMLFVGIALVRLLFPFEFPFTMTILLPQVPSEIISFFREPQVHVADVHISLWNVFEAVWVIGIMVKLYQFARSNCRSRDYILKYGEDKTEDPVYRDIMDRICQQYCIHNTFRIVELSGLSVPMILGRKNPTIIMPDHLSIPPDKLYYILSHEVLHHLHHSFLIKGCIQLLSIIYWWNPACGILYEHSDILLEMHIDRAITQRNPEITTQYAACLLYMKQEAAKCFFQLPACLQKNALSFVQTKDSDFKKRVLILVRKPKIWKRIGANALMATLTACILVASYGFILEAHYRPSQLNENYAILSTDNTYFIVNDVLGYDLYVNHEYVETVNDLEFYPKGIKIYDKEGVLINEN